jgi:hypothetical protein
VDFHESNKSDFVFLSPKIALENRFGMVNRLRLRTAANTIGVFLGSVALIVLVDYGFQVTETILSISLQMTDLDSFFELS